METIKKAWYGGHSEDIYDPGDFEELWRMEDQQPTNFSKKVGFLEKAIGKTKTNNILMKENNKEYTTVLEHSSITPQSEVIVIEPRSFDEALEIVEELRCRRSVVLNLQYLDSEQSQRVVDFLSGATHALDGHQQRIGQGVFIFAPSNFTINTESQEARALKDAFWGRNKEKEQQMTMSTSQYQYSEPVKKSSIF
ncbi:MAG: hypothetical protein A3B68_05750 [Candidatus Melainabacteria bacterium RIFCSPHIGHO2_02_FULL_34_12]|nr:MAG: hypothetical protein A3B68_05750 [Candidatus Melainabacteria bacterium RIFCSPHIGHO2_02_FULL_34_12]